MEKADVNALLYKAPLKANIGLVEVNSLGLLVEHSRDYEPYEYSIDIIQGGQRVSSTPISRLVGRNHHRNCLYVSRISLNTVQSLDLQTM